MGSTPGFNKNGKMVPLKQLYFKVVVLLALISGQRLQTLTKINIKHINQTKDNLQVFVIENIKISGRQTSTSFNVTICLRKSPNSV